MGAPKLDPAGSPSNGHVAIPINDNNKYSSGRSHVSLWDSWTRGISGGRESLTASRDRMLLHVPVRNTVENTEDHAAKEEIEEKRHARWRTVILATWILAGLAVAAAGATWFGTRGSRRLEDACADVAYHVSESWRENEAQVAVLRGLMETFYVNMTVPILTADLFRRHTVATRDFRPSVASLSYAIRLPASDRPAFERAARQPILDFAGNYVRPAAPFYAPVLFTDSPTELPHKGFRDMYDDADFREAMDLAEETAESALSVPILSANGQNISSVLVLPFFSPFLNSTANVSTTNTTSVSWLLAIIQPDVLVQSALKSTKERYEIQLWIYDVTKVTEPRILYTSDSRLPLGGNGDTTVKSEQGGSAGADLDFGDSARRFVLRCGAKRRSSFPWLAVAWPVSVIVVTILVAALLRCAGLRIRSVERAYGQMRVMRDQTLGDKLAAEAADSYKSQFLATVSHEIRTPLNGVLGMLTLLRDTKLDATQIDYVQTAVSSGKALIGLINDVLDFSKIEAGKMEIDSAAFNIRREVDDVLSLFAEKVRNSGIELAALVQLAVPTMVVGDSGRFRQVLINLVGNATKFTENGHILVTIRQLDEDEDMKEIHSFPPKPIGMEPTFPDEDETGMLSPPRGPVPYRPRRSSLSSIVRSSGVNTFLTQTSQNEEENRAGWMGPLFREQMSDKKKGWKNGPNTKLNSKPGSKSGSQGHSRQLSTSEEGLNSNLNLNFGPNVKFPTLSGKMTASGAHTYENVLKWMHQKPSKSKDPKVVRLGIAVEDTGNGIPLAAQGHIFQAFRQADSSTNRKAGGTGIGLSISKCLVELQGGTISFVSRPTVGSTFYFDLRLAAMDPLLHGTPPPPASDPLSLPHVSSLPGLRVLLVDTSKVRRTVLANHLRALGVLSDMADSPLQAVSMAQSLSLPFEQCDEKEGDRERETEEDRERKAESRRMRMRKSEEDEQGKRVGEDVEMREGRRRGEGEREREALPKLERLASFEALVDMPRVKSIPSKKMSRRRSMEAMADVAKSLSLSRFSPFNASSPGSISPSSKESPLYSSPKLQSIAAFLSNSKEHMPFLSSSEKANFRSVYAAIFIDMDARDWTNGGLELGEMVKDSYLAGMPLILVARRVDARQQENAIKLGFKAVLLKPLRIMSVAVALGKALGFASTSVQEVKLSPSSATSAQLAEILKGKLMLCVDDNLVNRRVAGKFLAKYGVEAVCLPGGALALDYLKEKGDKVDLVLMDIQMPEMDGYEASQKIRELEKLGTIGVFGAHRRHLPIVAMTADVLKGTKEKCTLAGMDGFITKPIDPAELFRVVSRFFPMSGSF